MKPSCPRLFEAEALRDGRLTGADVTRFQAHLKSCVACAREAQALQQLGDELRALPDPIDELRARRERIRLLAAFDARLVPAPRRRRLELGLACAAILCVLSLVAFWRSPAAAPSAGPATSLDPVGIQADNGTKWSRRAEAQLEKVILDSGTLSIHVSHGVAQRRLLVILPDGELEDIGTTFSVSADGGRTTRVSVRDGKVALRLHGAPTLRLGAGDSWSPAPLPTPVVDAVPALSAPAPRSALSPPLRRAAPSTTSSAAPPRADPAADFRTAMSALDSGDNHEAAERFGAFVEQHPADSRAEDAAYLRVLALQRAGDASAMKRAAEQYLSRYPRGFRKAEIQALVAR